MKLTKDRLTGEEAHGFIKTNVHESSQKRSETKKSSQTQGLLYFLNRSKVWASRDNKLWGSDQEIPGEINGREDPLEN